MRKLCFALAIILWVLTESPAWAQWRPPFPGLRVITTEHFEIIYPPASEETARTLAGFADRVYTEVSALIKNDFPRKLTVAITPATDMFNSYVNPLPYFHMVLLDTAAPLDDFTSFTNNLEGLFTHELTHALSMSVKGPEWTWLHRIFGGWAYPMLLTMPGFMAEGTAVSFESRDGITGRANDPLIREGLIQAVYEDKFLDPVQALGLYDLPHLANPAYHYGGLFSAWLQEKYGMEKFAALWAAMGGDKTPLSFWVYRDKFFGLFTQVYARPFPEAWDEWKESLRISGIEENPEKPVFAGVFGRDALITAVGAGGGKVFATDRISGKVFSYDPLGGKPRNLMDADGTVYNLAASATGDKLLLSSYRRAGSLNSVLDEYRAVVTEYDAKRGWKTGRAWTGLYDGRYFRDGVIGIGTDRHNNRIVFRPSRGEEEVLLRGTEELVYADPVSLDDTWIAFIAAFRGERRLCLFNYDSREVFTLDSVSDDDGARWRYIRGLDFSEGKLLFSYDHDRRMYKLGLVEMGDLRAGNPAPEALFSGRDFSGGVFQPVIAGGEVFYRGAFASGDALMKFPERAEALSGLRVSLETRPWDDEWRRAAGLPERAVPWGNC